MLTKSDCMIIFAEMETRSKVKKPPGSKTKSEEPRPCTSTSSTASKSLRSSSTGNLMTKSSERVNVTRTSSAAGNLSPRGVRTEGSSPKSVTLTGKPTKKSLTRSSPRRNLIKDLAVAGPSRSPRSTSPPRPKPASLKPAKTPKNRIMFLKKSPASNVKSSSSVPHLTVDSLHKYFSQIDSQENAERQEDEQQDLLFALHSTQPKMNLRSQANLDDRFDEETNDKDDDTDDNMDVDLNLDLNLGPLTSPAESYISLQSYHSLLCLAIRFDLSRNTVHYISNNDFPKFTPLPEPSAHPKKLKSILKKESKFDAEVFDEAPGRNSIDTVSACKVTNGKYMYYTKEEGGPVTELDSYQWLTLDQMAVPANLLPNFWKSTRVVEAIEDLRDWLNFPNFYTIPNRMLMQHFPLRRFSGMPSKMQVKKSLLTLSAINRRNRTERMWHQAKNALIMQLIHERRERQLKDLEDWQEDINAKSDVRIKVQNFADLEHSPKGYVYVSDYISVDMEIPDEISSGCVCRDCGLGGCCWKDHGLAYNIDQQIIAPLGFTIVECNSKCLCQTECPNRVVQYGPVVKIEIFRKIHAVDKWCVRTREEIPKGQFVFEFIGEIITRGEAQERSEVYNSLGYTHLLDLDYNGWETPYTIDTTKFGNAARFVSHSCEPNLVAYAVFIDNANPDFPRIALFAARDIRTSEELTFDYFRPGVWEYKKIPEIPQPITDAISPDTAKSRNRCTSKPCRRFLSSEQ